MSHYATEPPVDYQRRYAPNVEGVDYIAPELHAPTEANPANVVTSNVGELDDDPTGAFGGTVLHAPALDIDIPMSVVRSSTPRPLPPVLSVAAPHVGAVPGPARRAGRCGHPGTRLRLGERRAPLHRAATAARAQGRDRGPAFHWCHQQRGRVVSAPKALAIVGGTFAWSYHRQGEHGIIMAASDEWVWYLQVGPYATRDGAAYRASFGDVVTRDYFATFAVAYQAPAAAVPLPASVAAIAQGPVII
jgi:hypothetical protein